MFEVPNEIKIKIFLCLDVCSLFYVRRVSQRFLEASDYVLKAILRIKVPERMESFDILFQLMDQNLFNLSLVSISIQIDPDLVISDIDSHLMALANIEDGNWRNCWKKRYYWFSWGNWIDCDYKGLSLSTIVKYTEKGGGGGGLFYLIQNNDINTTAFGSLRSRQPQLPLGPLLFGTSCCTDYPTNSQTEKYQPLYTLVPSKKCIIMDDVMMFSKLSLNNHKRFVFVKMFGFE